MPKYCAEIEDGTNKVLRVVVAPSVEWCRINLGGMWEETKDPYADDPEDRRIYCGPGFGFDYHFPENFAPAPTPTQISEHYQSGID